jgi:hypothetical protein
MAIASIAISFCNNSTIAFFRLMGSFRVRIRSTKKITSGARFRFPERVPYFVRIERTMNKNNYLLTPLIHIIITFFVFFIAVSDFDFVQQHTTTEAVTNSLAHSVPSHSPLETFRNLIEQK